MIGFCVHEFKAGLHVLFWPSGNIFTLWQLHSKGRETQPLHVYTAKLLLVGPRSSLKGCTV
jgi:hypothetical protein